MTLADSAIRQIILRFSRWHWVAITVVFGIFLAFVSTLFCGALIGIVTSKKLWWGSGVLTTLVGLFLGGYILGRLSPREILWEFPGGAVLFAVLFMFAMSQGGGVAAFIAKYFLVPALAGVVCYLGVAVARKNVCPARPANPA
jgi:hypothetical protein